MHEQLLGYLLCALEPDEHEQVERWLQEFDGARKEMELLKRGLEPLELDEREQLESPPELAVRTCQLIRQVRLSGAFRREES